MKPYIKPPEPNWTAGEQLRFAAELLHVCILQLGTLQHRAGLKPGIATKVNAVVKKLDYSAKELTAGHIKPGTEEAAADYFDNEGALLWEVVNETRKMEDRRNALALLYAYNAGLVAERPDTPPRPMRKARRTTSLTTAK